MIIRPAREISYYLTNFLPGPKSLLFQSYSTVCPDPLEHCQRYSLPSSLLSQNPDEDALHARSRYTASASYAY